jgi:glycine betaine/proline transport system permease protein
VHRSAPVFFFGVGTVPGIVATIFFAMPLPIRLTAHGLRGVEREVIEAGEAFGANRITILFFIKLPSPSVPSWPVSTSAS